MTPNTGLLNQIVGQYQVATMGWYSYLFPLANHLFAMLAIIELAWSGIWWAMDKSDISSFWSEFLKKIMTIGFFYTLLLNAHTWLPAIIQSFMQAGETAGQVGTLDPGSVFDQGISIISNIFKSASNMGFFTSIIGGAILVDAVALSIFIAFGVIAGLLTVTLIESYIVIGAGILLLGFSGSRWTTQYATNYLSYAASVGVKLFMLYLVIGVGKSMSQSWGALILNGAASSPTAYFEVMGGALVFVMIAWAIPSKAASLLSGASNSSFGGLTAAAGAVGAAALLPAKAAFGTASAGMQAIRQAATIAQGSDTNMAGGLAKGVLGAGLNLATSMLGSATGHYANTGSAMAHKTENIIKKQQAGAESRASNTAAEQRPPPSGEQASSTTAGTTGTNGAAEARVNLRPSTGGSTTPPPPASPTSKP